jgi:hypothetical protein
MLSPERQKLQDHFLNRMARLARISQYQSELGRDSRQLLRWAISSTYRDCARLRVAKQAMAILRGLEPSDRMQ